MLTFCLLRHAKSSWKEPALPDHDRPLNTRGKAEAPVMGKEIAKHGLDPDLVLCSTARRTRDTLKLVLPELKGRLDGLSMRVPVPDGSVTDLVVQLERETTVDEINAAYQAAADGSLKGYLSYTADPIVSSDIVGTPWSCTFDSLLTMAQGDQVKVIGWYDNEWGYSNRLADLAALVGAGLAGRG